MAAQVTRQHSKQDYLGRLRERLKLRPKTVLPDRPRGFKPSILIRNAADEKYVCSDCRWILRQPLQSFCGHRYCTDCFQYVTESSLDPVKCKLCIQEGTETEFTILKREQTFPDNGIRREVDGLDSACMSRGCDWAGKFKDYQTHEAVCPHKEIQCLECGGYLKPQESTEHRLSSCPTTPTSCPHCELQMTRGQLKFHNCPMLPVICKGCGKTFLKNELLEHSEAGASTCGQPQIPCVFGCDAILEASSLKEHLEINLDSHICDINQRITQLEVELKDVFVSEGGAPPIAAAAPATAPGIVGSPHQYEALERRVRDAEFSLARLSERAQSSTQSGSNATLPLGATTLGSEGGVSGMGTQRQIEVLDKKMLVFERVSAVFKREIEKIGRQVDDLLKNNQENKDRVEASLRQSQSIERQFTAQKTTVTDLSQRILTSEASSNDGILIWKLNTFHQRRQDAISGRVTSFYSPCFFTSRTGYKACTRIYLNGDGMGKNSHVSLFFVLMRGEFDALLPWPFQQKVTLMWMDQNKRENVIDTFRPDPTSSSFKRPTSDMNIASGCPLFMPIASLESPTQGYVKDDVAFIKISIDRTNLGEK